MQQSGGTADDAARDFLQNNDKLWRSWVPSDVAERVTTELR
jgi:ABC-type proline/glycine betaine transport system substrate-binding protein